MVITVAVVTVAVAVMLACAIAIAATVCAVGVVGAPVTVAVDKAEGSVAADPIVRIRRINNRRISTSNTSHFCSR